MWYYSIAIWYVQFESSREVEAQRVHSMSRTEEVQREHEPRCRHLLGPTLTTDDRRGWRQTTKRLVKQAQNFSATTCRHGLGLAACRIPAGCGLAPLPSGHWPATCSRLACSCWFHGLFRCSVAPVVLLCWLAIVTDRKKQWDWLKFRYGFFR